VPYCRSGAVISQADLIVALNSMTFGAQFTPSGRIVRRARLITRPCPHDQYQRARSFHQSQLSGISALPGRRSRNCATAKKHALLDRTGEASGRCGSKIGIRCRGKRLRPFTTPWWKDGRQMRRSMGCEPNHARAPLRRTLHQIRMTTGRWWNCIRVTWPHRLWNFDKHYRWIGTSGGAGVAITRQPR